MQILKDHLAYFICFLLFLIAGAALLMNIEQGDAILWFSERRAPAMDFFFKYFTKAGEEYGYIIVITCFIFVRYRFALLALISGLLALLLSYFLKSYFMHPRPKIFFTQEGTFDQIHLVDGVHILSSHMSFPSGHTASAFALFGLVAFLVRKKWYWQVLLFLAALLVGISRMYLVQHFLKDVYLGAIVGMFIALLLYIIHLRFPYHPSRWIDRYMKLKNTPRA